MDHSDRYRFILGATIVIALLVLASAVALGHVEEKTSYGLTGIIAILGAIALRFSDWAFGTGSLKRNAKDDPEPPVPPEPPVAP